MKAAKEKMFLLWMIASAVIFCAPIAASGDAVLISKTRAEFKTDSVQNRVSESPFYTVKRDVKYDLIGTTASESSVAPNSTVLRNLGSADVPFDAAKLAKIQANLEKRGVTFVTGEEGGRLARALGGEAVYIPEVGRPGIIAFGPNASRTAVIEELLHFGQHRNLGFGAIDDLVGLEISAQHKLLETGRRLGWTPDEISRIERALEFWKGQR